MMSRFRVLLLLLCATVSLGGCATVPQGQSAPSSRARLTQTDLEKASSDNLYDAISKLRPEWLSSRGATSVTDATPTSVSVFMNGNMMGKADALRQMTVVEVAEIRYWDAAQASARFGMGHPRGVLEIIRK
jgi:hypothetical protein